MAQTWNQWGGGPRHTGSIPVYGHTLREQLADVVYDPFVDAERSEAGGSLLVHYQTPLSDGNDVFMATKSGSYTGFRTWETQVWSMRKFEWVEGQLVTRWTAQSDWNPVPSGGPRFEPVFHGALTSGHVYIPARGGTVFEVDRATGARRRLGLFGLQLDPTIYVTGPITVTGDGILYYNTLQLPSAQPWAGDHNGAWLVKITPDGVASRVSYAALVPARRRRMRSAPANSPPAAPLAAVAQRRGTDDRLRIAARRAECRAGGRRGRHGLHDLASAP